MNEHVSPDGPRLRTLNTRKGHFTPFTSKFNFFCVQHSHIRENEICFSHWNIITSKNTWPQANIIFQPHWGLTSVYRSTWIKWRNCLSKHSTQKEGNAERERGQQHAQETGHSSGLGKNRRGDMAEIRCHTHTFIHALHSQSPRGGKLTCLSCPIPYSPFS